MHELPRCLFGVFNTLRLCLRSRGASSAVPAHRQRHFFFFHFSCMSHRLDYTVFPHCAVHCSSCTKKSTPLVTAVRNNQCDIVLHCMLFSAMIGVSQQYYGLQLSSQTRRAKRWVAKNEPRRTKHPLCRVLQWFSSRRPNGQNHPECQVTRCSRPIKTIQ